MRRLMDMCMICWLGWTYFKSTSRIIFKKLVKFCSSNLEGISRGLIKKLRKLKHLRCSSVGFCYHISLLRSKS